MVASLSLRVVVVERDLKEIGDATKMLRAVIAFVACAQVPFWLPPAVPPAARSQTRRARGNLHHGEKRR